MAWACLPIRQISSLPFLEVVNTRVSVGAYSVGRGTKIRGEGTFFENAEGIQGW